MKHTQHVYLVDDDQSMLETLKRLFVYEGYEVHAFADCAAFYENFPLAHPSVVILDMQMPKHNGLDIQAELKRAGNPPPVIFLSGQSYPPQIVSGLKNGAFDFLFKPVDLQMLLDTVERGIAQDKVRQEFVEMAAELKTRHARLTPREKDVCLCLAKGLTGKDIATHLGISSATVKIHKARVFEKMSVQTSTELLKLCLLLNLLTPQAKDLYSRSSDTLDPAALMH
jgi:FixJ family two-component response regulator